MSNFDLQYTELSGIRSRVQGTGGSLANCATRLRRQMDALSGQSGFGIGSVRASIGASASALSTLSSHSYTIAAFLSELERNVSDSETQAFSVLAGVMPTDLKLTDGEVAFSPDGSAPNNTVKPDTPKWVDLLFNIAGEAGFLGSTITFGKGIFDFLTGGNLNIGKTVSGGIKTLWDFGTDIKDFIGDIKDIGNAKQVLTPDSVKAAWADKLFGIGPVGTATTGKFFADWGTRIGNFDTNFSKTLKNSVDDFVGGPTKSFGKAAAKWAGVALSGAVNFFENKEEHGGITARGVAETVLETGVDVGVGLLVGAAVTALAPVSAPVLAVAAVSAGVVMGVDWVFEKITGKDLAETVSDGILDVGEKIVDTAKDVGNKIKDGFNSAVNCFSNAIGNISAGWSGLFGF